MKGTRHNGRSEKMEFTIRFIMIADLIWNTVSISTMKESRKIFTGTAIRVTVLRAVPKRGSLILQKLSVPITMSIIQILWMHRMRGMSRQGIRRETERLMMY